MNSPCFSVFFHVYLLPPPSLSPNSRQCARVFHADGASDQGENGSVARREAEGFGNQAIAWTAQEEEGWVFPWLSIFEISCCRIRAARAISPASRRLEILVDGRDLCAGRRVAGGAARLEHCAVHRQDSERWKNEHVSQSRRLLLLLPLFPPSHTLTYSKTCHRSSQRLRQSAYGTENT